MSDKLKRREDPVKRTMSEGRKEARELGRRHVNTFMKDAETH